MRIESLHASSPYHRELFDAVCTASGIQDIVLGGDADVIAARTQQSTVIAVKTQRATFVAMPGYNVKALCTEQECSVEWYDREGRRLTPAQILAAVGEDAQHHIQVVATDGTAVTAWEWLMHHRRR